MSSGQDRFREPKFPKLRCRLPAGQDKISSSGRIGSRRRRFGAQQPLGDALSVSGEGPNVGSHEQRTFNPGVVGSNPTGPSIPQCYLASRLRS